MERSGFTSGHRLAHMSKTNTKPSISELNTMRKHASHAAQLLKALANENRLLILCLLAERECSVSELNLELDLSQSSLSQHLALLRAEGLVISRREAQLIYYSLAPGPAFEVMSTLHRIYCVDRS